MSEKSCVVFTVEHRPPMQQGCKRCNTILETEGRFTIGVTITDGEHRYELFLGRDAKDQPTHCGERKSLTKTFKTKDEAEAEKTRIINYLNEKGSTEGLPLLQSKARARAN